MFPQKASCIGFSLVSSASDRVSMSWARAPSALSNSESVDGVAAVTADGATRAVVANIRLPAPPWRSANRLALSRDRPDFSSAIRGFAPSPPAGRLGSGAGLEVDHLEDGLREDLVPPLVHHCPFDDATRDLPRRPHLFRPHVVTALGDRLDPLDSELLPLEGHFLLALGDRHVGTGLRAHLAHLDLGRIGARRPSGLLRTRHLLPDDRL